MKKMVMLFVFLCSFSVVSQEKLNPFKDYFLDYQKVESEDYYEAVVFSNYVVLGVMSEKGAAVGFEVYVYDREVEYLDHSEKYTPIYISEMGEAAWLMGIIEHYLLIDHGTAPGLRGIEVVDLNNRASIFKGTYASDHLRFISPHKLTVHRKTHFEEMKENNRELYDTITSRENFEEQKEWIAVYRESIADFVEDTVTETDDFVFQTNW